MKLSGFGPQVGAGHTFLYLLTPFRAESLEKCEQCSDSSSEKCVTESKKIQGEAAVVGSLHCDGLEEQQVARSSHVSSPQLLSVFKHIRTPAEAGQDRIGPPSRVEPKSLRPKKVGRV